VTQSEESARTVASAGRFPDFEAAAAAAEAEAASAREALAQEAARLAAVERELEKAHLIGSTCDRCKTAFSAVRGNRHLCWKCDRALYRLRFLPSLAIAASMAFSTALAALLWNDFEIISMGAALAIAPTGGIGTFGLFKLIQGQSRRQLENKRVRVFKNRRDAAAVDAQTQLQVAKQSASAAEERVQPLVSAAEQAQKRLKAAQQQAEGAAQLSTERLRRDLEMARDNLHSAVQRAIAEYDDAHPRPKLPRGVEAETEFVNFDPIRELKGHGWHFGKTPNAAVTSATCPANVEGLVGIAAEGGAA
jgi:hypothetical protein